MPQDKKYTYKGKDYSEKALRGAYPNDFDALVEKGVLTLSSGDTEPKKEKPSKAESMYEYQGKAYKETALREAYPDKFDSFVEQGVLKKKEQAQEPTASPSTSVQEGSLLESEQVQSDYVKTVEEARTAPLEKLKNSIDFYQKEWGQDLYKSDTNEVPLKRFYEMKSFVETYNDRLITEGKPVERLGAIRSKKLKELKNKYVQEGYFTKEDVDALDFEDFAKQLGQKKADEQLEGVPEGFLERPVQSETGLPSFVSSPFAQPDNTQVNISELGTGARFKDGIVYQAETDLANELTQGIKDDFLASLPEEDRTPERLDEIEEELFLDASINLDLSGEGRVGTSKGFITSNLNTFNKSLFDISTSLVLSTADLVGVDSEGLKVYRKEEFKKFDKYITRAEGGIVDNLKKGNYNTAVNLGIQTTIQSSPYMLTAAVATAITKNPSAAIATMSLMGASQQYGTVVDEDWFKELNGVEKGAYLFVFGAAESVDGLVAGKILSKTFQQALLSGAKSATAKKALRDFLKTQANLTGRNIGEEALTEGTTSVIQYMNDQFAKGGQITLEGIMSSANEGMVSGGFSAGQISTVASLPRGLKLAAYSLNNTPTKKIDKQIKELKKEALNSKDPVEIEALSDEIRKLYAAKTESVNRQKKVAAKMSDEDLDDYMNGVGEINLLQKKYNDLENKEGKAAEIIKGQMQEALNRATTIEEKYTNQSSETQSDKDPDVTKDEAMDDEIIEFSEDDISQVESEIAAQEEEGTLTQNIGEKAYRDGEEGMIKIDDENENTIVFETNDKTYVLGNKDDVGDNFIADNGLSLNPPEGVNVNPKDSKSDIVSVDGVEYTYQGRAKDKKGKAVVRVKEVSTGLNRRISGDKAERILKDVALRDESKKGPKPVALKTEGKEKIPKKKPIKEDNRAAKEAEKAKIEAMNQKQFDELERKAKEDVAKVEEELLTQAVKESKGERLLFKVGDKEMAVREKPDGTYSVSQKNANGKYVGIKDEAARKAAVSEYKTLKEGRDSKRLADAQSLSDDFKKEQDDKLLAFLDKIIDSTSAKGRAFDATLGLPLFILNSSAKIVKAAYIAKESLSDAIQDGIKHIKAQGYSVNENDFKRYIISRFKKTTPSPKPDAKKPTTVKELRAAEQKELSDAIPNIEDSKTDGKVDREKLTDTDKKKFDVIYDKYDKLITPLLDKGKKSPSVNKILGVKPSPKKGFTTKQLLSLAEKDSNRGAKEGARQERASIKDFAERIKKVLDENASGIFNKAQLSQLANAAKGVVTPSQLKRFERVAEKIMADGKYAEKLQKADGLKSKLLSRSKQKGYPSNITAFMADFSKIKPSKVDDIDAYIKNANDILNMTKKPSFKDGEVVVYDKEAIDGIQKNYVDKYNYMNEKDLKQSLLDDFSYLKDAGVVDASMTATEIQDVIKAIYEQEKTDTPLKEVSSAKKKAFENLVKYKIIEAFGTEGKDKRGKPDKKQDQKGLVDDSDFSAVARQQVSIIKSAKLEELTAQDLAELYLYLENLINNGKLNNMGSITSKIAAVNGLDIIGESSKGTKSSVKKWVEAVGGFAQGALSITQLFEAIGGSQKLGSAIYEGSGLYQFGSGKVRAQNRLSEAMQQFTKKFRGDNIKGKLGFVYKEITETKDIADRAIYGFLSQVPQDSYQDALDYISSSIGYYEDGKAGKESGSKGKVYRELFDSKYKDSKSIKSVGLSKRNTEVVDWFRKRFGEQKSEYFENAEINHNRTLEETAPSGTYLPFVSRAKLENKKDEDSLENPSSLLDKIIIPNRSGSTNKRKNLFNSKNRYMTFEFEKNMFSQMERQLMDIETSFDVKTVAAFFRNPKTLDVFGSGNLLTTALNRAKEYVNASYPKTFLGDLENDVFQVLNVLSGVSGKVALGGLDQGLKQSISVMTGAAILTSPTAMLDAAMNVGKFSEVFKDSPVKRRSFVDQDSRKVYSQIPEAARKSMIGKIVKAFQITDNAAEKIMMASLQKGDEYAAQVAWMAYYKQQKGDSFKGWDVESKSPNKSAAAYAELMVSNTQNVNDIDTQAIWLSSRSQDVGPKYAGAVRRAFAPFVSFVISQSVNTFIQAAKLFGTKGAKMESSRRIAAVFGENVVFVMVKKALYSAYAAAAGGVLGLLGIALKDDDEEEFDVRKEGMAVLAEAFITLVTMTGTDGYMGNTLAVQFNKLYFYEVMSDDERDDYTRLSKAKAKKLSESNKGQRELQKIADRGFEKFMKDKPLIPIYEDRGGFGMFSIGLKNHITDTKELTEAVSAYNSDEDYVYKTRTGNEIDIKLTKKEKKALIVLSIMENTDIILPNDIAKLGRMGKSQVFSKEFEKMYGPRSPKPFGGSGGGSGTFTISNKTTTN
jgi:hypothetical protein